MIYTQYAARTGRILHRITIPDYDTEGYDLHHSLLHEGVVDAATHYFVAGAPVERPPQKTMVDVTTITANGVETATISGLPAPCRVRVSGPWEGDAVEITDGVMSFAAALPGRYTLHVEAFPCLPWEVAIDAL